MSDREEGSCSVCGEYGAVQRRYFHYDVDCDCCNGSQHFKFLYHCSDCVPKAPTKIRITIEDIEATDA